MVCNFIERNKTKVNFLIFENLENILLFLRNTIYNVAN